MNTLIKITPLVAAAVLAGCAPTPETTELTNEYSSARITAPVTVTVAPDASPANRGQVDLDCPDDIRDDMTISVVDSKLTITSAGDDQQERCNVILHAQDGLELEVEHELESEIHHTNGQTLNLALAGAEELRIFTFGGGDLVLGDAYAETLNFEVYDDATVEHTGEIVGEEIRAHLYDSARIDLKEIIAQHVRVVGHDVTEAMVSGQAGEVKLEANHSTSLDASTLYTFEGEVDAFDSSESWIHAQDKAEVNAEDDAIVHVDGNPGETDVTQEDNAEIYF